MTFSLLPEISRGCLLILMTGILLLHLYGLVTILYTGSNKRQLLFSAIMTAISFIFFQGMIMYQQGDLKAFDIPVYILVIAMIILLYNALYLQYSNFRWKKDNISNMSIKEAFDSIPAGIAYATGDGLPIMVNEKMRSLSYELFGRSVTDLNAFWDEIHNNPENVEEPDGSNIKVKEISGKTYSIRRNLINVNDTDVVEVIAIDVSKEYSLLAKLSRKRDQLRIQNIRLKSIMETIEYITMNRELLKLKTRLHDNIGQSILIARRFLVSPERVDKSQMLKFWGDNIRHLIDDAPQEWELPYYVITKEADSMGINLNIVGSLPVEKELIPVVDTVISVMVGNTLKHTDKRNVTINTEEYKDHYAISLTDHSQGAGEKIVEKGGLKNLRQEVETIGGTMEVIGAPEFVMNINLPKAGEYIGVNYGA